jgi:hypothetical protein
LRVDKTLSWRERMKIRIRDANVPRNQTIRSDFDLLVSHNQCAVEQRKITDCALTMFAHRKRTARIT